jgi:hypothetical protein
MLLAYQSEVEYAIRNFFIASDVPGVIFYRKYKGYPPVPIFKSLSTLSKGVIEQ